MSSLTNLPGLKKFAIASAKQDVVFVIPAKAGIQIIFWIPDQVGDDILFCGYYSSPESYYI